MASVLMFNIRDIRKAEQLRILSVRLDFACREIPPDCQSIRICDLLEGQSLGPAVPQPFTDEMLVMDGFSHPDLNFLLNELIRTGNTITLKAVTTPVNREWTTSLLHARLVAENREMQSRSRGASR